MNLTWKSLNPNWTRLFINWFIVSALGIVLYEFLLADLFNFNSLGWDPIWAVLATGILIAAVTGILQYTAMRKDLRHAATWIPATIAGHALSAVVFYYLANSSWIFDLTVRMFETGEALPTAAYG